MPPKPELPILLVANASAWSSWLTTNGSTSPGVWLTLAKKNITSPTSLTYTQAVDEALCHGWIDGQARSLDAKTYSHRFTPRTAKSIWSKINVGKITRLESEGRMLPGGIAAVNAAKADGRWEQAYDGSKNATESEDFLKALKEIPEAVRMYEVLTRQNKYAIYHRLMGLKTDAGREKAIRRYVDMLARGETIYPQKQVPEEVESSTRSNSSNKEKAKAKRGAVVESDEEVLAPVEKKLKKPKVTAATAEVVVTETPKPRREGLRKRKSDD